MSRNILRLMGVYVYAPSIAALYLLKKLDSNLNEKTQPPKLKPQLIKPRFTEMLSIAIPVLRHALFNCDDAEDDKYVFSCPVRQELNDDLTMHPGVQSVNRVMDKSGIKLSNFILDLIKKGRDIDLYARPPSFFLDLLQIITRL
jgi:hypothetical protein